MTTTAAPTTHTYRLVAINRGTGACDHCGRHLRNLCTITDGTRELIVGKRCCIELTGWTPDAARLRRQQREDAARARFGDLYDRADAIFRSATGQRQSTLAFAAMNHMLEGNAEGYLTGDRWITIADLVDQAEAA